MAHNYHPPNQNNYGYNNMNNPNYNQGFRYGPPPPPQPGFGMGYNRGPGMMPPPNNNVFPNFNIPAPPPPPPIPRFEFPKIPEIPSIPSIPSLTSPNAHSLNTKQVSYTKVNTNAVGNKPPFIEITTNTSSSPLIPPPPPPPPPPMPSGFGFPSMTTPLLGGSLFGEGFNFSNLFNRNTDFENENCKENVEFVITDEDLNLTKDSKKFASNAKKRANVLSDTNEMFKKILPTAERIKKEDKDCKDGELAEAKKINILRKVIPVIINASQKIQAVILMIISSALSVGMTGHWKEAFEGFHRFVALFSFTLYSKAYISTLIITVIFTFTALAYFVNLMTNVTKNFKELKKWQLKFITIAIIPFFLFMDIFCLIIIKICADSVLCRKNDIEGDNGYVMTRIPEWDCYSGGQVIFIIISFTTAFSILVFNFMIQNIIKSNDIFLKKMNLKTTINKCFNVEGKNNSTMSHNSGLGLVLKQSKLKKNSREVVSNLLLVQLFLFLLGAYTKPGWWWPPLILSFTCILVAIYFYVAIPYVTASTNNLRFAMFTSQAYNFIRTTLVTIFNPDDNIKNLSLISWVLLPVIFGVSLYLMNRRFKAQSFFYNESDDFNVIETESDKSKKENKELLDIVVKTIQNNRLVGVRASVLRREAKKNYDYHCQGVFSVDNDEGLFN
jgi:hypothetical protein